MTTRKGFFLVFWSTKRIYYAYDRLPPTTVGAVHGPFAVTIRCTLDLSLGSTHAHSRVSRVVKPGWTVSKIFFLGLSSL
jgi:hypothetical protein